MVSILKEEKAFRALMKNWTNESIKADKIFCHACARQDFNNKKLAASWTEYATLEYIGDQIIRDDKTNKIIGKMLDYRCPRGHGISTEDLLPTDEYGNPYDPTKVKKKKE